LYCVVDRNLGFVAAVLFRVQVLLAVDKDKRREERDEEEEHRGRRNRGMGQDAGVEFGASL